MPKEVDVELRRRLIAEATLAVGRRDGVEGTTIRAVARELGRSTVFITNYLGTRAELLLNALAHVEHGWEQEMAQLAEAPSPEERLRRLLEWSTEASEDDRAIRTMWLEILATPSSGEVLGAIRLSARSSREELLAAVREAGRDEALADTLFLLLRGFFTASVEDPEEWRPERARRAIDALLDTGSRTP